MILVVNIHVNSLSYADIWSAIKLTICSRGQMALFLIDKLIFLNHANKGFSYPVLKPFYCLVLPFQNTEWKEGFKRLCRINYGV